MMEAYGIFQGLFTLVLIILFVALFIQVFSKKRKKDYDDIAKVIFEDDKVKKEQESKQND